MEQSNREVILTALANAISEQLKSTGKCDIIFICTHNSRRSHFGQVWAQYAAESHGIKGVKTFSGGTEATAFHPNAIAALQEDGWQITGESNQKNPVYTVSSAEPKIEMTCFSKVYSDEANPQKGFIAVMTCTDADEGCPVVLGAAKRFSLPYEDPKIADGTSNQSLIYLQRSRQIKDEMMKVFSNL
ncbi:MAG: protein-tyrosine-phosphatase [Flavobacteriales bacterium]